MIYDFIEIPKKIEAIQIKNGNLLEVLDFLLNREIPFKVNSNGNLTVNVTNGEPLAVVQNCWIVTSANFCRVLSDAELKEKYTSINEQKKEGPKC